MKCYAYSKEAKMCLIYGCDCDSKKDCFHTSEQKAINIDIINDTKMNNHDTKKKRLLDLIEELKGKGVSANVSAQVAVSFMNGYTLIDKEVNNGTAKRMPRVRSNFLWRQKYLP